MAPKLTHKVTCDPGVRSTAFYETGEGEVRQRGHIGGYSGSRFPSVSKEDADRWGRVTWWAGTEIADDKCPWSAVGVGGVVASEDWWHREPVMREGGGVTAEIWAEWLVSRVAFPEITNTGRGVW